MFHQASCHLKCGQNKIPCPAAKEMKCFCGWISWTDERPGYQLLILLLPHRQHRSWACGKLSPQRITSCPFFSGTKITCSFTLFNFWWSPA
jgi:hypothetical protein